MGRWQPDARGRLAGAAFQLYADQGYDATTGAQIATRAGMHERSFFRLFPDKAEVLFLGIEDAAAGFTEAIAAAPEQTSSLDAVAHAVTLRCSLIQDHRDTALLRHRIIASHPELRERDLAKHAELAATLATALTARGVPEPDATLTAGAAMTAFTTAFATWVRDPSGHELPALFRGNLDALAAIFTRGAVTAAAGAGTT